MIDYSFVYELMRAYKDSNLLINKRVIGGKVEDFLDIPGSYRQIVRDSEGKESRYQYIEFSVPNRLKREKKIEDYLRKIEEEVFKGKLLHISDEEIERFNEYWDLPFLGLVKDIDDKSSGCVIKPDGEKVCISLRRGKRVRDVFEVFLKPLAYF